jgi:D-glycero-D-manno-heptose 1,7-bisphosphate phosphatase
MNRAVFLDRDGVINRAPVRLGKPYPPGSLEELEILPGVVEALEQLQRASFLLIVVTNQPDVARGTQTREVVEAMHAFLQATLPITETMTCYEDGERCPDRKPNPGMLLKAAALYDIDVASSFMVGDRWRDVEAGRRAGCQTVFLDYQYQEPRPDPAATFTCANLRSAANWILTHPTKANL